jgi:outer membrane murein-binding lipoprotein Lpp
MKTSKHLIFAVVAVSSFVLAGCQSIEDQIAGQIGEKIAETAVEQATGGKAKIDVSGGNVSIKTAEGEMKVNTSDDSFTMQGPEGEAVFGGGDTRPSSVDQDLPNVEGATEFGWAGSKEGGMLSFSVSGIDHKVVCAKEIELLGNNGWKLKDDFVMEFEGMTSRTLEKDEFTVSVSCSAEKEDNKVSVVVIKSKKSN